MNTSIATLQVFFIVYTVLYTVAFFVSMYKIFDRAGIKKTYALIPFVNLFFYFKLLKIKTYYLFIPIINLLIFFFLPYNVADIHGLKNYQKVLSVLFPFVMLTYIAFGNFKIKQKIKITPFVRTTSDIDVIEQRLQTNPTYDYETEITINNNISNNQSALQDRLDKIEYNAISGDYYDELSLMDEEILNKSKEKIKNMKEDKKPEVVELEDDLLDIVSSDIRKNGIDIIESNIEENNKKKIKVNDQQKEYKDLKNTDERIAFGGSTLDEKVEKNKIEAKIENLKCPKCGSSLVGLGPSGSCPGCGMDVREYIYTQ